MFRALDLRPVTTIEVLTPSTRGDEPHRADMYDVGLSIVGDGGGSSASPDLRVMEADCWRPSERLDGLIGMDILKLCFFQFMGPEK